MTTSGTYAYALSTADVVIEAFERLGLGVSELQAEHMASARRSLHLVLSSLWLNRGINLWRVDEVSVPLVADSAAYNVDPATVSVLDAFVRLYQLGAAADLTPGFATTNTSATVTITKTAHGLAAKDWLRVVVPVAIGGLVIEGYYQVVSVTGDDAFTITAAGAATSTASGGAVPSYATTAASATVTVTLAAHGHLAGQTFTVNVATAVGGISLLGDYTIASAPTADTLTITAASAAGSTASASENGGNTQIASASNATATDQALTPISRGQYANLASKTQAGVPTQYWFERLLAPRVTLWPIPDANGPYEFRYYRLRRLQDAAIRADQEPDVPDRFTEALCAQLAHHLSMKWRPDRVAELLAWAKGTWDEALNEDREKVAYQIDPDLSSYYR